MYYQKTKQNKQTNKNKKQKDKEEHYSKPEIHGQNTSDLG